MHILWGKWKCLLLSSVQLFANPWTVYQPTDSYVHGILQARILEWIAIPFSTDPPHQGIEPESLALQTDSLPSEPPGKPIDLWLWATLGGYNVKAIHITKTTKWLFLLFIYCCILPWWMKSSLSLKFLLLFQLSSQEEEKRQISLRSSGPKYETLGDLKFRNPSQMLTVDVPGVRS